MYNKKYYKCVSLKASNLEYWGLVPSDMKKFLIGKIYLGVESSFYHRDSIYIHEFQLQFPVNLFEEVTNKEELEALKLLYE